MIISKKRGGAAIQAYHLSFFFNIKHPKGEYINPLFYSIDEIYFHQHSNT